jgi:hypothetical protein
MERIYLENCKVEEMRTSEFKEVVLDTDIFVENLKVN